MKNFNNVQLCIIALFYFLSSVISIGTIGFAIINFKFSLLSLLVFICFLLIYIQLPGSLIRKLFKIDLKFSLSNAVLGFILGLGSLFSQYYLFNLLNIIKLIVIIGPMISLISICYFIKGYELRAKRRICNKIFNLNFSIIVFISSIVFFISMLKLQFNYVSPDESPIIKMGQDFIWHLGNINTLSKEGLALDPRVCDMTFKYHYFSDLIFGICKYITGLVADIQMFSLAPFLITYLIVGSFYAFATEFIKCHRHRHLFVFFALFASVATFIVVSGVYSIKSIYFDHIFSNVNAVGFSISVFLIGTVVISQFIKNNHRQLDRHFVGVMIMIIFICTGMKGPFAAVLVTGLVCTSLLLYIKKDDNAKRFFIFTVVTTVMFGIIYLLLLSSPAGGGGVSFSITHTIERSVLGLLNRSIFHQSMLLWSPLLIVVEFILLFGVFAILFIGVGWLLLGELFKARRLSSESIMKWFMLASSVIGCGGFFLLNQSGLSQVYFLFCIIPFIQLFAFEYVILSKHKLLKICFLGSMAFGIGINIFDTALEVSRVNTRLVTIKESQNEWRLDAINADEYEALLWIRENTPTDSILISNRQSLISDRISDEFLDNRFFYYSAYSDRNFFLEGFSYSGIDEESLEIKKDLINTIFYSDDEQKYVLLKANQIDYIIEAKINSDRVETQDTNIVKCFENNSVVVYKVK